jgi:hypothetical protein
MKIDLTEKAIHSAVYWQNRCCDLEEIIEQFCMDADATALVQEPVAWKHTMIEDVVVGHRPADLNVHPERWMPLYKGPTPCQTCQSLARAVMMDQTAHDTTPPAAQRQSAPAPEERSSAWVGLTDEEIDVIDQGMCGEREFAILFALTIEDELKAKNSP